MGQFPIPNSEFRDPKSEIFLLFLGRLFEIPKGPRIGIGLENMDRTAITPCVRISRRSIPEFECYSPGTVHEHYNFLFASSPVEHISQFFINDDVKFGRNLCKSASHRNSGSGPKKGRCYLDLADGGRDMELG